MDLSNNTLACQGVVRQIRWWQNAVGLLETQRICCRLAVATVSQQVYSTLVVWFELFSLMLSNVCGGGNIPPAPMVAPPLYTAAA